MHLISLTQSYNMYAFFLKSSFIIKLIMKMQDSVKVNYDYITLCHVIRRMLVKLCRLLHITTDKQFAFDVYKALYLPEDTRKGVDGPCFRLAN